MVPRGGEIHSTVGDYKDDKCEPPNHFLTLKTTMIRPRYAAVKRKSEIMLSIICLNFEGCVVT